MFNSQYIFVNETTSHTFDIEKLNASAFGPGRHARAAARIREQGTHELEYSFVCLEKDILLGSVRMTPILIGEDYAYLLGPLAVHNEYKKQGIGRKLVEIAINSVANTAAKGVLLVGDHAYYAPMGFEIAEIGSIIFPGPVDLNRVLICNISGDGISGFSGVVKYHKF